MQQTLERPYDGGSNDEYIEIEAIVHASDLPEVVRVKRGATPQEALDAVIEAARALGVTIQDINLWNVLINDREIVIENGKVKHNAFVLNENATLIMSQRVVGGPEDAAHDYYDGIHDLQDDAIGGPEDAAYDYYDDIHDLHNDA